MDHDYLWDLPRFEHKPVNPPRKGHLGEQVFYSNWLKVLQQHDSLDDHANQQFVNILGGYGHRLDERVATVAATFVTWLGTNLGNAYRIEAKRLASMLDKSLHDACDAYLWTWASVNLRGTGSGSGLRQLEASMGGYEKDPPLLTSQDYEVIDHLAYWLGSNDGQAFLEQCEADLKQRQHEHDFRAYLEKTLNLQSFQVEHVLQMAKNYRPKDELPQA